MAEVVTQHLAVPPPALHEKVPTIPPAVEQVVLTALAKDPKERFSSVQAFAIALELACQRASARPAALTSETPIQSQPLQTTDTGAAIPPSQLSQSMQVITPPNRSQLPTEMVTPSPVVPPTVGEAVTSSESHSLQPSQHRLSRRAIVMGLVGLTGVSVVAGSIAWLARSRGSLVSSATTYPVAPANFPMFAFDLQRTHFNPNEHVLSPMNVSQLIPYWTYSTRNYIISSPVVANGVVYMGSGDRPY